MPETGPSQQPRPTLAQRVAEARELRRAIEECTVTVRSRDRSVTVTASPGGAVTGLELTPRALRYSGRELGDLIMATIRQANEQVDGQISALAGGLAGTVPDVAGMLSGRLPEPAQEG